MLVGRKEKTDAPKAAKGDLRFADTAGCGVSVECTNSSQGFL